MKGLLLKDFYTLAKQAKFFLIMILVFACIPVFSMSVLVVVYATMLPITALAYDERAKWNYLAAIMPYSVKNLVLSKFLLGFLAAPGAAILSLAAQTVVSAVRHNALDSNALPTLVIAVCAALVLQAVNLPFMFKLGVECGRLVFFVLVAVITLAGAWGSERLFSAVEAATPHMPTDLAAVAGATLLVTLISIRISERLYAFQHA